MSHPTLQELTESVHGLSPAPEHLASCAECRDTGDRLRAELDLLRRADARLAPRASRRHPGSAILLALAAAVVLAVTALIVIRSGPDLHPTSRSGQDKSDVGKTIDAFLNGKDEEAALARKRLAEGGPEVLGALVDARLRRPASIRPDALAALILEMKEKRAGDAGAEIFGSLRKIRITVDMQNAPMTAIVDYLQEITRLNISADPALKPEELLVNLKVADVPLNHALDLLGFVAPMEYDVRYGVLFIGAPERLFATPKAAAPLPAAAHFRRQELGAAGKAALKKMNEVKIDLAFENALLTDLVTFIRDFSGLNVIVEPGLGDQPVTFKSKDLAIGSVLELLALPRGLDVRLEEGTLLLYKPKK